MDPLQPQSSNEHLLDIEPDPQAQLEFQNFVLSSAEADLIAGKVSTPPPRPTSGATQSRQGTSASPLRSNGGMSAPPTSSSSATGRMGANDDFGFSSGTNAGGGTLPLHSGPGGSGSGVSGSIRQQQQHQSEGPTGAFWTTQYWSFYFRVNNDDVGNRILTSVVPNKQFMDVIGTNPDLYGPFWIATTVIFSLFATSTMAESIARAWSKQVYVYDVTLLSIATIAVYSYVVALPAIIWGIAKYYKIENIRLFDMINVYGYGLSFWVPVALLCIIQSEIFRWALVLVAFGSTTFFLVRTIHPLASQSTHVQAPTIIFCLIVICQIGMALLFKIQFFQHSIVIPGTSGKVA